MCVARGSKDFVRDDLGESAFRKEDVHLLTKRDIRKTLLILLSHSQKASFLVHFSTDKILENEGLVKICLDDFSPEILACK